SPVGAYRLIGTNSCVVRDVDAVDGQLLSAPVGGEGPCANDRHSEVHTRDRTDGGSDILREETAVTGDDLESSTASHCIDDLSERAQDSLVDEIDRAHERDATSEGENRQSETNDGPAQKAHGHAKAKNRHDCHRSGVGDASLTERIWLAAIVASRTLGHRP